MPQPFIVYGDGPRLPTGLARIARDLTAQLHAEQEQLGISVLQVGLDEGKGNPIPWPLWTFQDQDRWGVDTLEESIQQQLLDPPVVLAIWDPSRCYPLSLSDIEMHRWGYFPIDSANIHGMVSGPAGQALHSFNRVLAYGEYGRGVLEKSLGGSPVQCLPHGIADVFQPEHEPAMLERAYQHLGRYCNLDKQWLLGCVATNQPRKDLSLFFGTLSELRRRGHNVYGWLHTDRMVHQAWSVPQLVSDFGLAHKVTVTISGQLHDAELAALYRLCRVTLHPGLGEGFGYPIVESMACGVPPVHGDFGGGVELIPRVEWKVPRRAERLESVYALVRPVFTIEDFANAVERAYRWHMEDPQVTSAYLAGQVSYLRWSNLWPRWREWFSEGLKEL